MMSGRRLSRNPKSATNPEINIPEQLLSPDAYTHQGVLAIAAIDYAEKIANWQQADLERRTKNLKDSLNASKKDTTNQERIARGLIRGQLRGLVTLKEFSPQVYTSFMDSDKGPVEEAFVVRANTRAMAARDDLKTLARFNIERRLKIRDPLDISNILELTEEPVWKLSVTQRVNAEPRAELTSKDEAVPTDDDFWFVLGAISEATQQLSELEKFHEFIQLPPGGKMTPMDMIQMSSDINPRVGNK